MKLLFTICGRAGSKGAKGKNIRDFMEFPLVYYTLSVIDLYQKKHGSGESRSDIALSTDSPRLIELVQNTKLPVFVVNRSAELSGDFVAKPDVIRDCTKRAEAFFQTEYDMIVDLDITSPLRRCEDLEAVIRKKSEKPQTDLVFTVTEARRNPYFNMVSEQDGSYRAVIPSDFVSRQQAPAVFDMNASIYAYSRPYLYSEKSGKERVADIVMMKDTAVLDIDSDHDFELMQLLAEYFYKTDPAFAEVKNHIPDIIR